MKKRLHHGIMTPIRVGFFLAVRQIKRSNIWTNVLIVFIMTLTFLNLVTVSGILVGLVEGISQAVERRYLGDLFISNLQSKTYIEQTPRVLEIARGIEDIESFTVRYIENGVLEANYKEAVGKKKSNEIPRLVTAQISGIDPIEEQRTTGIADLVVEGEFISPDDFDEVVLGATLLQKYLGFESDVLPALENVEVGSTIRMTINGSVREVKVKGILRSKVDELDRRVYMVESQLRNLINRFDYNADEIAIQLRPGASAEEVKQMFLLSGAGEFAKVRTPEDAEPKFVKDIKDTFEILGNAISSIGLAVACITIFIVIFISAVTRRKYIGILKGVGISSGALEFAYILQSIFYAVIGTAIGCVIVFGFLKPYFDANPIDFPFSDGILVVTPMGTMTRVGILLLATLIAGYIPARMIVKQNTLDAILGR